LGARPEFVSVPSAVLENAGWSAAGSPYFHRRPFILDTRRAELELGYDPLPPEDGLERAARWFRDGPRHPVPPIGRSDRGSRWPSSARIAIGQARRRQLVRFGR
jgi:hypothetical protein